MSIVKFMSLLLQQISQKLARSYVLLATIMMFWTCGFAKFSPYSIKNLEQFLFPML
jgi:hypothetical protein